MKRFIFGSIVIFSLPMAALADTGNQTPTATTPSAPQSQTTNSKQQTPSPATTSPKDSKQPITGKQKKTSTKSSTATKQPANAQQPMKTQPQSANTTSANQPSKPQAINCDYKLSENVNTVPTDLIKKWTQNAAEQSFTLSYNTVDENMKSLEKCFTKNGWKSFNTALERSGNLATIKKEKLNVMPKVTGELSVSQEKDNQWKVTLPMMVTYKNDKEKIDQELNISILVGRKTSGDLGVIQLIAAPTKMASEQSPSQKHAAKPDANAKSTPAKPGS